MKTITYNPETHVIVPREPSGEMCDAATADSCWENMNPPPSIAYRLMLAAAPQPEPNHNWCAGCSPDNCSGCGAGLVDSEPAMWVMKHIRSGDLAQAKPNQKALDAERLDFILRKQLIVIQDCDDKYFTYNAQSGKRGPEMDSEAEAIDAAMAQGEQK